MYARALLVLAVLLGALAPAARASDCTRTSTGLVPLTDLGTGTYRGAQGGLYAGGSNQRPAAHDAAGVSIANAIAPLDTLGQPDAAHGSVVLISIGMSNCVIEFNAFVPKVAAFGARNPQLRVINCAEGGQSADRIRDPASPYWDFVASALRSHGSSPLQPQAVWLKEAVASPTGAFPASAESLTADLGAIVHIIHDRLPNVRLVYFTSRIYAGYATSTLNPEPYAYESGFAVKALIDAQIAGTDSLVYDPAHGAVRAPWLAWGPYLWADGLHARSDGLTWACSEFQSDGTHPSPEGADVVADSLLRFFARDETTAPWFVARGTAGVAPPRDAGPALALWPNPARGSVSVRFATTAGAAWRLDLVDAAGRSLAHRVGIARTTVESITWDVREAGTRSRRPGIYWVRLTSNGRTAARRMVIAGL